VLPPIIQIGAVAALTLVTVALSYFGITRNGSDRALAEKETAIVQAETANADLQVEVSRLQDRLALVTREREEAKVGSDQADSLRGEGALAKVGVIGQLKQALAQTQTELRQAEIQRATLATRLGKIEAEHSEQQGSYGQYKASIEAMAKKLNQVSAERDKAVSEKDRLRARIAVLEQKRSQRRVLHSQNLVEAFRLTGVITTEIAEPDAEPLRPEPLISDAPPEPASEPPAVAEFARRAAGEFARVLASTGLDVQRLFPQFGSKRAEGGPFVVPPKGDQPRDIGPDALEAMRSLIRSLPLSAPLDRYQLESRFGPRRDPFNRRVSFHTGLDLSAAYISPIYATAAGTVTYAGYRADYGKVVEIDHGNGIATLYGHLHRYIVSVGQTVGEHTQIGFLGSTGRSSGPHVHYEILVNDEPQDPEKFLGLARVIPAADR
jgi:murein DD-endopeptidase MepM/ murein hydrolase activator NlpD